MVFRVVIFLFAGRRPAVAGLLGVPDAPMSGPGLHPASHGPSGMLRSQALLELASAKSSVLSFGKNAHYPAIMHERSARRSIGLMAD
ncbi:hypothetical protein MCP_1994 [Methanocella paludicola SANAE]|uniref:Uncharacterized protein n=1 Tax=Methanocella paludicola (strain DSM 17711 / JCM 13418 / NBRC 101707 / SANAE) TaxID=304371 RepID=D1Z044_METPS|nr:hypothetical protein MCP_1994 [Methanocella paludicola SANAE]